MNPGVLAGSWMRMMAGEPGVRLCSRAGELFAAEDESQAKGIMIRMESNIQKMFFLVRTHSLSAKEKD
jgi:hypothetical protein